MACDICGGKRHLFRNGVWVPCECLKSDRLASALRGAGVYSVAIGKTIRSYSPKSAETGRTRVVVKKIIERLLSGRVPTVHFWFYGKASDRMLVAGLLLEAAYNGGFSIRAISLDDVLEASFRKNPEEGFLYRELIGSQVQSLMVGEEQYTRATPHFLYRYVLDRQTQGRYTFYFSKYKLGELGDNYNDGRTDFSAVTAEFRQFRL